jgi:hypothetical protein
MPTKVAKAVKTLTQALHEDPDLYLGYHANIAMAFKDAYDTYTKMYGRPNRGGVREIAHQAATNFLRLWMKR